MTALLDSSVLVAAVVQSEAHHEACHALLEQRGFDSQPARAGGDVQHPDQRKESGAPEPGPRRAGH